MFFFPFLFSFLVYSDAARYRTHGKVVDARIRVPGEGSEAVHGRLWQHPQHEQCQSELSTLIG